jgi:acetylornithine deacetylase
MSTEALIARVTELIESRRGRLVDLVRRLVRIPSVVGTARGEAEVQAIMATEMAAAGMTVDSWEPALEDLRKYRGYVNVERDYSDRPVVVGVAKGSGGGPSLAFNVHIDVVPIDPNTTWSHEPFGGEVADGKLYGRGSADMKGGVAAAVIAAEALRDAGVRLRGDLMIQSVSDEEDGGNTTLACIDRGHTADATVFLEPTSPDYVYVSGRGAQFFRITVSGTEGGVEWRHELPNAIEKAMVVYRAVDDYWRERESAANHPLYRTGPRSGTKIPVAVCKIQAGAWPSTVPGECIMEGTLECLPGEDIEAVKEQFREHILRSAAGDPWLKEHPPRLEWFGLYLEPAAIDPDDAFVRTLVQVAERVNGKAPAVVGGGGNDLRLPVLYAGKPAVLFGPRGSKVHSVDEWVEIEEVVRVAKVAAALAIEWCGAEVTQ